jgi:cytochrome oxidase complex assembly protein 1
MIAQEGDAAMLGQLPSRLPEKARRRKAGWIVRAGTGAMMFALLTLMRAFLGLAFGAFRRSQVYAEAMSRAISDPEVRRELGEPVRAGWWVNGRLSVSGPSGEAGFTTPLHGPDGQAMLSARARKVSGRWVFDVLEVAVEGRLEPIRLHGRTK